MKKNDLKIKDLKCPNCGADLDERKYSDTTVTCPYCRSVFDVEKEKSIEEKAKDVEKLSYADEKGRLKALDESKKNENINKIIKRVIKFLVIFFAIIIICAIASESDNSNNSSVENEVKLPEVDDPFKYINVEFSGNDGQGSVTINKINSEEVNVDNISYKASNTYKLVEGETITIYASSYSYNLNIKEKQYTITGLVTSIKSFDELTENIKKAILDSSKELQKEKINDIISKKGGKIISLKPYKMYIVTDGKLKSDLYDIHAVQIKGKDKKTYKKYVATKYKDFRIVGEKYNYSNRSIDGHFVEIGDLVHDVFNYTGAINGYDSIGDFKNTIKEDYDINFNLIEEK